MKKLTVFMRFSLCFLVFFLSIICIFMFPAVIIFMNQVKIDTLLTIIFGIGTYTSALGAYLIIFFTWRLLYLIDKNRIFSNSGIFALNKIKKIAFIIAAIYALLIPSVTVMSDAGCAPGVFFVNIFLIGLGATIGVFANILEKICLNVFKFQIENELTI